MDFIATVYQAFGKPGVTLSLRDLIAYVDWKERAVIEYDEILFAIGELVRAGKVTQSASVDISFTSTDVKGPQTFLPFTQQDYQAAVASYLSRH